MRGTLFDNLKIRASSISPFFAFFFSRKMAVVTTVPPMTARVYAIAKGVGWGYRYDFFTKNGCSHYCTAHDGWGICYSKGGRMGLPL